MAGISTETISESSKAGKLSENELQLTKDIHKPTDRDPNLAELSEYRDGELRKQIAHAWENCPKHRERMTDAGVTPDDIQTRADLVKLPVMTRTELHSGMNEGLVAQNVDSMNTFLAASGGTTGQPVQVIRTVDTGDLRGVMQPRYVDWWGRVPNEKTIYFVGSQIPYKSTLRRRIRSKLIQRLQNQIFINTNTLTERAVIGYYKRAYRFNPVHLFGYAGSIHELALYMEKFDLPVWSELQQISSASEQLNPTMRSLMTRIFDVPIMNIYQTQETGLVAVECPEENSMHIMEERVIIEVVDDVGTPVLDQEGRILLTSLCNYATPLFRYAIGDIGVISSEPCQCGRAFPVLKEITGRSSDIITLGNGTKVFVAHWGFIIRNFSYVKQACVRLVTPNWLQIDLVLSRPLILEDEKEMRRNIKALIGDRIDVELRTVDRIAQVRSGKIIWFRRAEDEIDTDSIRVFEQKLMIDGGNGKLSR